MIFHQPSNYNLKKTAINTIFKSCICSQTWPKVQWPPCRQEPVWVCKTRNWQSPGCQARPQRPWLSQPVGAPRQDWPLAIKTWGEYFSAGLQLGDRVRGRRFLCLYPIPSLQSGYVGTLLVSYQLLLCCLFLSWWADLWCCSSLKEWSRSSCLLSCVVQVGSDGFAPGCPRIPLAPGTRSDWHWEGSLKKREISWSESLRLPA